ncbi:MAG: polysaccharide biosynthesis protein, partial [Clostridia bacterium]|nr:polysaccharide biosynthesis protein [Clostridia bacterium]
MVKSVGLISKIALNRVVGSIGAGYYSSAYEIYAFLYVISTAGLPVAISIMISKAVASGKIKEANKIFDTSFIVFMTMGLVLSGLMLLFSGRLAEFIGAPETKLCIITIAPTIFFICISSCIRGYFQGFQLMAPTAISQFIEAICKVGIGVSLALYAKSKNLPDYTVAAYTVAGVTTGVFLGMVYLYIKKLRFKENNYIAYSVEEKEKYKTGSIIRQMLTIGIPVTVSSTVLSLTTVFDTLMVQTRLLRGGLDPTTVKIYYGDYTSLVISMFNLPTILLYPIANALVPLISGAVAKGSNERSDKIRSFSMRIIAIIALPCAIGMSVFSAPILRLLMFKNDSVDRAAPWLSVAAVSVIFLGIISVTN